MNNNSYRSYMTLDQILAAKAVAGSPGPVIAAYKIWDWKASKGAVRVSDWDLDNDMTLIDVKAENPRGFWFRHYGGVYGEEDGPLTGKGLFDFPSEKLAYEAAGDYMLARNAEKPEPLFLHAINQGVGNFPDREFIRVLLPLVGADGEVERICNVYEHI